MPNSMPARSPLSQLTSPLKRHSKTEKQRLFPRSHRSRSPSYPSRRASGRGRDHNARPIKYLTTNDLEAAGVGLPRSSNSRMISRTRWAQSARNDRKPRCRYKTGTGDPPASARIHKRCLEARHARRDTAMASAQRTSLCSSLPRTAGSRKFVVDLPTNRLGPRWRRGIG